VISGDDKALTLLVQAAGWQVRYQETAQVYTPGATEMRVFLKQRLRWARNSWRADLKALFSRWVWRKPLLAFHLIDRLLQPLTTLVAPLYIIAAAYHGHWLAIAVVVSWWFLSRAIKILPHLRRHWSNIQILPWYIFFNYWSAVLKIYAFFTMNQQGWITRWNQSRMSLAGPLRLVPGYLATTSTVSVLAILVFLRTLSIDTTALSLEQGQQLNGVNITSSMGAEPLAMSGVLVDTLQLDLSRSMMTAGPAEEWLPIFSPDGRQIVFVSEQLGAAQLFLRDPRTGRLRLVPTTGQPKTAPVWSPDSRKVAFVTEQASQSGVEVVDLGGGQHRWLPSAVPAESLFFTWRLDSQSVILSDQLAESPTAAPLLMPLPAVAWPKTITSSRLFAHAETQAALAQPPQAELTVLPPAAEESRAPQKGHATQLTAAIALISAGLVAPVMGGVKAKVREFPLSLHTARQPALVVAPTVPLSTLIVNEAPVVEQPPILVPRYQPGQEAIALTVTVPQIYDVHARYTWSVDAPSLLLLARGSTLSAVGRSLDNAWIQVVLPDQRLAWLFRETMLIDPAAIQSLPAVVAP
jgi:hypothetical protein